MIFNPIPVRLPRGSPVPSTSSRTPSAPSPPPALPPIPTSPRLLPRGPSLASLCAQSDHHVPRLSVLDRIVYCFPRDVIEVRRHIHVVNQHRCAAFKSAA